MEDIYPENPIYAATIRSHTAKGRLKFIHIPVLPDGYILITAKEIPGENRLEDTDIPVLAYDKLSYIGEPVAILLGRDKTVLEDLASKSKVIAEEEPPVFDCKEDNAVTEVTWEMSIGNAAEIFEKAGNIVAGNYITGIQDHWYAEPAGAITWWNHKCLTEQVKDDNIGSSAVSTDVSEGAHKPKSKKKPGKKTRAALDASHEHQISASDNNNSVPEKTLPVEEIDNKTLTVRTATQWPNHVKRSVVRVLGIDQSNVSVEPTTLNLHMDGKLWYPSLIACHAALGTYISNRPVRLILSREDDFLYSPKRCKTLTDIASIVNENGEINAIKIDTCVNIGAFGVNSEEIIDQVSLGSLGLYKFDNVKLSAKIKKTNIPPQSAFSGFGLAQGLYAIERHISQIADSNGQDPAIWRLNHIDTKIILPPSIPPKTNVSGGELLNSVIKMSDYYRKWSSNELLRKSRKGKIIHGEKPRGIGIAAGYQSSGLLNDKGSYCVEVTLTRDSTLEIKSNIVSFENYQKLWQRIVMETISIEPEMVKIIVEEAPDCGPSCASRNITVITKLVEKCCLAVKNQRFQEPLPITVRRFTKPHSGSLRDGNWNVLDINGLSRPGLAAAVVEVTVDLIEYIPLIRGIWMVVDGGKIISVNRAKRNLTRSINQAIGWAFTENIDYVKGTLPKNLYDNFSIFSMAKIPPIYIDFLQSEFNDLKGIGDLPFTCIPAAFMQAVSQAMDHCFKSIPLKRNDIWEMLRLRDIDMPSQTSGE